MNGEQQGNKRFGTGSPDSKPRLSISLIYDGSVEINFFSEEISMVDYYSNIERKLRNGEKNSNDIDVLLKF